MGLRTNILASIIAKIKSASSPSLTMAQDVRDVMNLMANSYVSQVSDTSANFTTNNPILETNQIGFESDTNKFKLGDGATNWNTLGYANAPTLQQVLTNNNDTATIPLTNTDGIGTAVLTVSKTLLKGLYTHTTLSVNSQFNLAKTSASLLWNNYPIGVSGGGGGFTINAVSNSAYWNNTTVTNSITQNASGIVISSTVGNYLSGPINEVSQDPTTALGIATRQFVLANVPSVSITSVFGRTGAVIAVSGDYTTALVTETTNLYYTQTRFDTAFTAKSTTNLTEGTNLYFTNPRSIASTLTSYVSGAGAVSSADSIISAIQKLNGNIALVSGAIVYQGLWNASTNTPTLVSGVGTKGTMYKVSVAGTTTIDGISQWNVGDQIMFDGTTWDKLDGIATEVLSVNGAVGAVTLTTANVSEVTNLYFTNARAITALTGQSNTLFTNGAGYLVANQTITLSGDVTGSGTVAITTAISNTVVTGKLITGYISGAGVISATDSILSAIQKLNGNILPAPTLTSTQIAFGSAGNAITSSVNLIYSESGVYNFFTIGGVRNDIPLFVTNRNAISTGYNTDFDPNIVSARTTPDSIATNSHGFVEASVFKSTTNGIANNAFTDNGILIDPTGSVGNYNHHASYQSQVKLNNTGTTSNLYFCADAPTVNNGTLTKRYGYYFYDGVGTGTIINQYGVYIPTLIKGTTANEGIHVVSNSSYFGGALKLVTPAATANTLTPALEFYHADTTKTSWIADKLINNTSELKFNVSLYNFTGYKEMITLRGDDTNTNSDYALINASKIFIGGTTIPTAKLHITAGSATAGSAPLKLTSGPVTTTAEVGAIEFLNDSFYATITTGAVRKTLAFTGDSIAESQVTNLVSDLAGKQPVGTYASGTGSASGTNTGDNATNTQYANDYRLANFVAGTNYLAPNGSAAALTSFPTLNQSTTGNASTATNLTGLTTSVATLNNTSNTNTGDVAVATTTDIITGTDNVKTISALGLANSSFLNQAQAKIYAVASGTDTYAITLTPAITVLTAGLTVNVLFTNANTTAITMNVNALGAKAVTKDNILALVLGDIKAGVIYTMTYDGTRFQCDCGEALADNPVFTTKITTPQINGVSGATGLTVVTNNTASGAIARGNNLTPTLIASANNDVLVGLDINPTFTNGAFTGVANIGARVKGDFLANKTVQNNTPIFKLTGIGNYAGSPTDNVEGVGIGLVYNSAGNRQFWIGDSGSGNGIRIANNAFTGWNYQAGSVMPLLLDPNSAGVVVGGYNTTPTALIHIGAGIATANKSPLKFTSGVNLTTVENGAVEYDGTKLTITALGTRQNVMKGVNGSFSASATAQTAFVVTFGGTQPNATYQVFVTPTNALSAASLYVVSKTTTTFTVTFLTGLTGTVSFDWGLIQ